MIFRVARSIFPLFLFLLVGLTATAAPADQENKDSAKKSKELYDRAMAVVKESLDEGSLREAIGLLEKASEIDPSSEEIWIQISWRYWMLGDSLPKDSREEREVRLELFEKGVAAGEKAMEFNRKSIGGMYWYTVNLASSGEMRGVLSSLWMAGTLFGNMSRVDRRDPYYLYGATRRFGSEVYVRVPRMLTERFGFKTEYIIEDLEDNIEKWPNYFDNYTFLARIYWLDGKKDKALELLEFVLYNPADIMPEEKAENEKQQKVAREMWKEYTGKEYPAR